MYILAFETSCDDTSIALFNWPELITMSTASQIKVHNKTGGVVPEIASREHANAIFWVLEDVLTDWKVSLEDIDYIWVTTTPGLIPSLLTGITVARTLGNIYKIPVIDVNHIEAHIFSNFLEREESEIEFPLICLSVSGGHNDLFHMENMWSINRIGTTQDDAAWEAFDKVAKMMWLGYPGWPIISKLATEYDNLTPNPSPTRRGGLFPRSWLDKKEFWFSFSGLKSAVKREVDKRWVLSQADKIEISYEFQEAVVEVLAGKLMIAADKHRVKTVMLTGWVSANDRLRELISEKVAGSGYQFLCPTKKVYCMDNAAMVGINAYYKIKYKK